MAIALKMLDNTSTEYPISCTYDIAVVCFDISRVPGGLISHCLPIFFRVTALALGTGV